MSIVKMLRSLPKNSSIPCKYKFDVQEKVQEGLIEVGNTMVFLKHDNPVYVGSGEPVKPYKHSWFLCMYNGVAGSEPDVECLEVLIPTSYYNIGEL